jgi:hypothetical protein
MTAHRIGVRFCAECPFVDGTTADDICTHPLAVMRRGPQEHRVVGRGQGVPDWCTLGTTIVTLRRARP